MRKKLLFFIVLFLTAAGFTQADDMRALNSASYSDLFLSSRKADIAIYPAPEAEKTTLYWKDKNCRAEFKNTINGVLEINITPRRQHVFIKKLLGMAQNRCKVRLEAPPGKMLYVSSETGNLRLQGLKAKNVKLYTMEGRIETEDYTGNLSAETLTGRITLRNTAAEDLHLNSANGTMTLTSVTAGNADILNTSGHTRIQGVIDSLLFYSAGGDLFARWDAAPQNGLKISARAFAGDIKIIIPANADLQDKRHNIALKSLYGRAVVSH